MARGLYKNVIVDIPETAHLVRSTGRVYIIIVLVGKCVGPTSDNYQIMGIDCFYAVPKAVL